ncbi:hypothetical protein DIE14_30120 [Burkholderia sp. Bp9017]|nr:hypothetical protein DIE14_30120 [Burkholderia sp. Bp9017]RQZ29977.1 hypothetical protein DIE13_25640 [Burkholderia sp. Bp9016]
MSSRRRLPGIRVSTGLTGAIRNLGGPHPTERFPRVPTINSIHRNFLKIHPDDQNSKLTLRNMAG